jgi:predicted GNAT family N-acyltransferase
LNNNNKSKELVIKVVENEEERLKAFLIRGIVYMHEQQCPYAEEFDLNDFTATQIIGLIGNEPILTARIRYFSDFAKLERLAIRTEYRNCGCGHKLIQFLIKFCLGKGYQKLYLHAQSRLEAFYSQYKFKRTGDTFYFSDHSYIEMLAEYKNINESNVNFRRPYQLIGKEPLIIDRPEGNHSVVGPLEKSLERLPEFRDKDRKSSDENYVLQEDEFAS